MSYSLILKSLIISGWRLWLMQNPIKWRWRFGQRLGKSGKRRRRIIQLRWRSGQLGPEFEEVLSCWRRGCKFMIRAKRAEGWVVVMGNRIAHFIRLVWGIKKAPRLSQPRGFFINGSERQQPLGGWHFYDYVAYSHSSHNSAPDINVPENYCHDAAKNTDWQTVLKRFPNDSIIGKI